MTSNLAFSEWNRVFVDDKLTAALLDRLAQHAEVLVTRGPGDRIASVILSVDGRTPYEERPANATDSEAYRDTIHRYATKRVENELSSRKVSSTQITA